MGGYASIPLSGVFPQIQTPLQIASQAQGIRNAQLQNQIGQQDLQQKAMQNALQRMQMQQMRMFMATPDTAPGSTPATSSSGTPPASSAPSAPPPDQSSQQAPDGTPDGQAPVSAPAPDLGSGPQASIPLSAVPGLVAPIPAGMAPTGSNATPGGGVSPISNGATGSSSPIPGGPGAMGLGDFAQAGPQQTSQIPQVAPVNPAISNALSPQDSAANMNFNEVGQRFGNKLRNYMATPGSNVMFAKQMYDGYIEQQTKLATLQKDQIVAQKQQNDMRATAIQGVIDTPEGPERQQAWTSLMTKALNNKLITMDQFKQAVQQVPDTQQLTHLKNQNLMLSEQAEMAEKQAQAAQAIARGQKLKVEADGRQFEQDSRVANATLTDDPAKFDDWKSSLPVKVAATMASVSDPYRARQVLAANMAPATEQDKLARQQKQDMIDEGVAAANAGPAQYGRWYGRVEATNPRFAQQLVKPDDYDEDSTPKQINDLGLSPEQRAITTHRDQSETDTQRRLDQADQRISNDNKRTDAMVNHLAALTAGQLTPGQQAVQDRFDRRQWVGLRNSEDMLHTQRNDLYAQLQTGKDAKGNSVDPVTVKNKLQSVNDSIQNKQYQKAELMGIETPDADVTGAMEEGKTISTSNPGVVWKKTGGIVYPVAAPRQAAPAPPPAQAPPPAPIPATPGNGKPSNTPQSTTDSGTGAAPLGKQTGNRTTRQSPPASFVATVPEGRRFQGPDGSIWMKKNGKAVPVTQ